MLPSHFREDFSALDGGRLAGEPEKEKEKRKTVKATKEERVS